MGAVLRAEQVTRRFKGEARPAVDEVSLSVSSGECVGVVGESGSGKSTLALMLMGLVAPDSGRVMLDGRDISHLRGRERRAVGSRIQMVFQDHADSFDPFSTLGGSAVEFGRLAGLGRAEARDKAQALFERVGLDERLFDARPAQASGGQRQRAAIARALMRDPEFLLCDEITSALDVSVQSEVLKVLADVRGERGVVFVTHDLSLVERTCDRVVVMCRGRIVEEGTPHDVVSHPQHPYTQLLVSSVLPLPVPQRGKGRR